MSNLAVRQEFSLLPTTFAEAEKYAQLISKSSFCPKNFQGNTGDVLIAIQMGTELGLKPVQALQNIAVINGKPSVYGDAQLAIVKHHPEFENITETQTETEATCKVKRQGQSEHTVTFTIEDAKRAGLWGKSGPWSTYPKRMLQMRARGFCLRDTFPDALKGFISYEEAQDMPTEKLNKKREKFMGEVETVHSTLLRDGTIYSEKQDIKPELTQAELAEELKITIWEKGTSDELVNKWLAAAKVEKIEDMTEEQLKKCIDFLQSNKGDEKC